MSVTEPLFMKLILAWQVLEKFSYKISWISDKEYSHSFYISEGWMDRCGLQTRCSSVYLIKNS